MLPQRELEGTSVNNALYVNPSVETKDFWTLDLGLSNKGPIWQATKIPAQARLALCGGGRSLEHSNPKALLSSAGVPPPAPLGYSQNNI